MAQQSNVLRMLGYFSLVGLQRVHALVGDYHGALKVCSCISLQCCSRTVLSVKQPVDDVAQMLWIVCKKLCTWFQCYGRWRGVRQASAPLNLLRRGIC